MTGRSKPRRTQGQRVAESRRRLLTAAVELISEHGFEKTTVVEIEARAGLSRSMVRARYGGKEQLLETLLREEFEPRMLASAPEGSTGLEQVLSQVELVRSMVSENTDAWRAFSVLTFEAVGPIESLRPWAKQWLSRYERETADAFRRGHADGSVHASVDADGEARRMVLFGLGLAFRWTLDETSFDVDAELIAWEERLRALADNGPSQA